MKFLRKGLAVVVVLGLLLVAGSLLLPASTHVERSVVIDRPPAQVFATVNSFQRFGEWSPWAAYDPNDTTPYALSFDAASGWQGDRLTYEVARANVARMRIRTDAAEALLLDTLTALEVGRADATLRVLEVKALAGEARLADAIRAELADGARRLGLDPARTRLGEGEEDSIELVGLLFESLFQTHAMLQRSRRLYARLVLPYVKVALVDDDVFVEREHPARRLLDAITEACEGNDGATPQDRELLKHAASAAHRVVADFNEDLAVFELAASELEALLQQQRQRVDAVERRAAEAVHGRERLLQARLQANAAVARRLAQVPVTAVVGDFLVDYWQHHVLQTLLRDGLDSQRHRDALALGEAIVEADRVAALGHGPAVADLLIALQPDIGECLASSGLDDAAARDWMAGLVRALARPDVARSLHALPDAPHAEEEGSGLHLVQGIDAHDFDPEVAERMRRLKPGDWVRVGDQDNEPVAAKIAWVSPLTARYLLVNRRGGRVLVASAEQLAALAREGRLEPDTEQAPFDTAMHQLRHRLDQAVGQD